MKELQYINIANNSFEEGPAPILEDSQKLEGVDFS
jgi:hypothetical protein